MIVIWTIWTATTTWMVSLTVRVNAHAWKSGMVFALGMLLRANHGLFIIYTVYIYGTIFHIVFREGRHSTKQIAVLIGKNSGVDVIA